MITQRPSLAVRALLLGLAAIFLGLGSPAAAQGHPCDPPNVLPAGVCGMDSFYGSPPRQIPGGWTGFVLSGDLTFMQDIDTLWGAPALRMWSNGGTFRAGIWAQAQVTPGAGYRASISWGAPNAPATFGRQLGIDPTGGTDPGAATVVWGPMHWGDGRILNYTNGIGPNIDVTVRAQNSVITVFFLVDHNSSTGDNFIFVDAIGLYPDEGAAPLPTATPLPPTATPIPPTTLPATATPTATSSPTPSPTATPSPSPSPTASATATPTPTATPSATPSPTPSPSPSPTITPTATATPGFWVRMAPELLDRSPTASRARLGLLVDLGGLGGLALAAGLILRLARSRSRGRGRRP